MGPLESDIITYEDVNMDHPTAHVRECGNLVVRRGTR